MDENGLRIFETMWMRIVSVSSTEYPHSGWTSDTCQRQQNHPDPSVVELAGLPSPQLLFIKLKFDEPIPFKSRKRRLRGGGGENRQLVLLFLALPILILALQPSYLDLIINSLKPFHTL